MQTTRTVAHTPTPWHAGQGNGEGSIFAGEGHRARLEIGGTTLYPIAAMVRGWDEAEDAANEEFIVRACNSHDDLTAAIARLVAQAELADDFTEAIGGTLHSAVRQAKAALARATGTA
jgi:hypothetical protein